MSLFDVATTLNASTSKDPRGLGLIEVRITQNSGSHRTAGRVNAQGGITYLGNGRDLYGAPPKEPTLILSPDEARILATALLDHLNGTGQLANPSEVARLKERLAGAERQNELMRKGKKISEQKLKKYEDMERGIKLVIKTLGIEA